MNQPLVSIGIPIYNVEKYIECCAESLFEQTYDNIEYIFINDCSPDKSIEILNNVIQKYTQRQNQIKIINHEKNKGLAGARNTFLDNSTGEFLIHVDSDDWCEKTMVEEVVKKQQEGDYDIVSFDVFIRHKKYTRILKQPIFTDNEQMCLALMQYAAHSVWGRLIRKSLYIEHNVRVLEGENVGEDFQVMPILAYYAKKVATLNIPLYNYNCMNESAYTKSNSEKVNKQSEKSQQIVKDFFKDKDKKYLEALEVDDTRRFVCVIDSKNINKNTIKKLRELNKHKKYFPLQQRLYFVMPNVFFLRLYIRSLNIVKGFIVGK